MKYTVIKEHYSTDLSRRVEKMMTIGWKPQGGVTHWSFGGLVGREGWAQAMVKEE